MRTWTVVDSNGFYQDVTAETFLSRDGQVIFLGREEEGKDGNIAYFYHPAAVYLKEG